VNPFGVVPPREAIYPYVPLYSPHVSFVNLRKFLS